MKDKLKGLGMGLDLLLKASEGGGRQNPDPVRQNFEQAREWFNQALGKDEDGNYLEAYYFYRRVADLSPSNDVEERRLLSQALNNIAIILYENGQNKAALAQLEKALAVDSDNQVARDNLAMLIQEV
ncbi:MAG TPA: tetratricopeptide repeat protein [Syntrophomonadaceae bacterium]|nr:tetratricopeptide repeat protein [Syntrophomonadaceae bacterium]